MEKEENCKHPQEMQFINRKSITINVGVLRNCVGKGRKDEAENKWLQDT